MKFSVNHLVSLKVEIPAIDKVTLQDRFELDSQDIPKLGWVPPMQRRRLSKFMKMALYCAYESSAHYSQSIPMVFSSRHGDLHKTSKLLDSVASDQDLSPTDFSMSVHNACSGLFSILTKNQESMNTIAAGKQTFYMALCDAYARLKAGIHEAVLVVHCDQVLPDVYTDFSDELQIDHALAFVMTLSGDEMVQFSRSATEQQATTHVPFSIQFMDWITSAQNEMSVTLSNSVWLCERNAG